MHNVEQTTKLRAQLGNCLSALQQRAPIALCLAPVCMAIPPLDSNGRACETEYGGDGMAPDDAALRSACQKLNNLVDMWDLRDCHTWAPLIDGKQVLPLICAA